MSSNCIVRWQLFNPISNSAQELLAQDGHFTSPLQDLGHATFLVIIWSRRDGWLLRWVRSQLMMIFCIHVSQTVTGASWHRGKEDIQLNLRKLPMVIVHLHDHELFWPLLKFFYGISETLNVCQWLYNLHQGNILVTSTAIWSYC